MLKTYRIIPLVFILFLFGFTLITVSPVFAQSTKDLEDRINRLEVQICDRLPELTLCSDSDIQDKRKKVEDQRLRERTKNFDKDPYTYAQTALFANHQMGNFAVLAFPKFVQCQSVRRNSKKQRNERNACSNPNLGFDFQINENDTFFASDRKGDGTDCHEVTSFLVVMTAFTMDMAVL